MRQIFPKLHNPLRSWMIFPLACALVVIGVKIWMIAQSGSPTPFWDQWDAEGVILYPKYFDGTLSFSDLIAPHNEHRILISRLWSLLLLDLNGYWDPILQMLANTAILGAFVALLVTAFRPILDGVSWIALVLFSTVIFALPFGWESTLAGFHSQWYFMLLFSIAGLYAIIDATAFTARWWLAMLLVTSYFSLAAGTLAAAAAFAVCVLQFVIGRRSGRSELLALAILAAVAAVMVLYTPVIAGHGPLRAHSIEQFLRSFMEIASWPATTGHKGTAILVLGAILIQAPSALVSIRIIGLRPPFTDRRWLLVALTGWAFLQAAAVAYGRAEGPTASRYLDVFAVALPLNYACLLYLLSESQLSRLRRRLALGATVLWLLLVLFGATKTMFTQTLPELTAKQATGHAETTNLRAYLDTGDIKALENKPFLAIPYPNPQRLAMIASQPIIRALLPPELVGEASAARAQQRGLARFTGRPIQALKNYALRWGVLLIPAGLTFFLLGLTMRWWGKASCSESVNKVL
jgi:hypothetical protein